MKNNIKQARTSAGLQQKKCAEKIGVTLRAWQGYEQGTREPKYILLCQIADLFGVTTDYLLGRDTGDPEPIDKLAVQFNISAEEKKVLTDYLNLPPDVRNNLIDILCNLFGT